jgi:membrane associated rhomboid family serine protease
VRLSDWKRHVPPAIAALIALTVVTSLLAAIDNRRGGELYELLALAPARVWQGEVWRLVTWTFVEDGPITLVFSCIALYWFGGDLVAAWGQRRFLRFVVAIVLVASVGTSLVGLVSPAAWAYHHIGGWALGDALVIAWALQFPEARLRIYQVLEVGGPILAYGTFAVTVLCVVYYGVAPFLPELLAGGAALYHLRKL